MIEDYKIAKGKLAKLAKGKIAKSTKAGKLGKLSKMTKGEGNGKIGKIGKFGKFSKGGKGKSDESDQSSEEFPEPKNGKGKLPSICKIGEILDDHFNGESEDSEERELSRNILACGYCIAKSENGPEVLDGPFTCGLMCNEDEVSCQCDGSGEEIQSKGGKGKGKGNGKGQKDEMS